MKPKIRQAKLLASAVAGCALLATAAMAQVAIDQIRPEGISIKGTVADIFGDKFVLEDKSGRILVQTGPAGPQAAPVKSGETVTVVGVPGDRTFDARKILRENGEIAFDAPPPPTAAPPGPGGDPGPRRLGAGPPPPPPPGAPPPPPGPRGEMGPVANQDRDNVLRILKDAGLTAMGEPVRHPKHIEIPARTGAGKTVIVSLDRFGRLDEIEDADRDRERERERRPTQSIGPADAERIAREAGYTIREAPEQRKHHYEILATNAKGEMLELHMDFSGNIYKQVWVR